MSTSRDTRRRAGSRTSIGRAEAEQALEEARRRFRGLIARLDDDTLSRQHSPLMSPIVWDVAHVANYEDLWLVRALGGDAVREDIDRLYDAFLQPRSGRPDLPLLSPAEAEAYGDEVRRRALQTMSVTPSSADPRLLEQWFVHGMVAQHEHQHIETVLATLQLMDPGLRPPFPQRPSAPDSPGHAEVLVPAGDFEMGSDDPWAYDNERPRHLAGTGTFWIDVTPVTNEAFAAFVDDGGYEDERHWTPAGCEWRRETGAAAPAGWHRIDHADGWVVDRFGHRLPLDPDEPVQHVCWYEADAFARWAGKRLPTETEWEKAAAWDPATGASTATPWGATVADAEHAVLAGPVTPGWGPEPVGSRPAGASPLGCRQMLGGVWEWTASDFEGYPGFTSFPYEEYSQVFFDGRYKVLRGGSWATHPAAIRTTFRNWDFPIRRQIFAGFRCARDA